MTAHTPIRNLTLGLVLLLPSLAGCGSKDVNADADKPVPPVADLYNNGVDALNSERYDSANDQFNLVEQNYPYSPWAVNAQLMQATRSTCRTNTPTPSARWIASSSSIRRIAMLPTRIIYARCVITSRLPTFSATRGHANGNERIAGGGEPLPR